MGDSTGKKSIIYLYRNGQTYCEFRKKVPKQLISLVAYWTNLWNSLYFPFVDFIGVLFLTI